MQQRDKLFINGKWVAPQGKGVIEVIHSATEAVMGTFVTVDVDGAGASDAAERALSAQLDAIEAGVYTNGKWDKPTYRDYLESRYHDDFDAWRAKYKNPFRDLQDGGRIRNWDDDRRIGDQEEDTLKDILQDSTAVSPANLSDDIRRREHIDEWLHQLSISERKVIEMRFGLVDGEPMIFAFGNPTRNTGAFYQACFGNKRHRWNHGHPGQPSPAACWRNRQRSWSWGRRGPATMQG